MHLIVHPLADEQVRNGSLQGIQAGVSAINGLANWVAFGGVHGSGRVLLLHKGISHQGSSWSTNSQTWVLVCFALPHRYLLGET